MKQKNTTTKKAYNVTPRTGLFLDAMAAIMAAEDAVLQALTEMYGDYTAEFEKIPFDAVKKTFAEYMYIGIAENMGDTHLNKGGTTITI